MTRRRSGSCGRSRASGRSWGWSMLYEIDTIRRFPEVGNFLSYARLVACDARERRQGEGRRRPQDRQRAPEVGVLGGRGVLSARQSTGPGVLARLKTKHGKGKSLSIIAARLARAVYFMLKRRTPFDAERFFAHSGSAGTKGSSLNVLTGAAVQGARPDQAPPNSLCLRAPQPSLAASGYARGSPAALMAGRFGPRRRIDPIITCGDA